MNAAAPTFVVSAAKDWRGAFCALRRLLADANDTAQVFRIMRALNAGSAKAGYDRLLESAQGGRIAYAHVELAPLLTDAAYVSRFPAGTLGAAYAAFLRETGFSAQGLAEVSRTDGPMLDSEHPYAWFGRRTRDVHDIWHILTGYPANAPLGEACLTGFSYAQTGGLGWAMIAVGSAFKALRSPLGLGGVRAVWEGYRHGRRAAWLLGESYETLLAEPLEAARARLRIAPPTIYHLVHASPAYEAAMAQRRGAF